MLSTQTTVIKWFFNFAGEGNAITGFLDNVNDHCTDEFATALVAAVNAIPNAPVGFSAASSESEIVDTEYTLDQTTTPATYI